MGFFSRKKKKDSFEDLADKSIESGLGLHDNLGLNEKSPFDDATVGKPGSFSDLQASQQQFLDKREMELINSKLETIKAILNSMDQRLSNLEKAAGVEPKQKLW